VLNYRQNGKRYRVTIGTKYTRLAKLKLNELKINLFKGIVNRPESSTTPASSLPDFFRRFTEYARNKCSPQHLRSDISRINNLQQFLARKGVGYLQDATSGLIEKILTVVLKGKQPKTKKNHIALLKTMLNYAVN
jgi:hypothetical protein